MKYFILLTLFLPLFTFSQWIQSWGGDSSEEGFFITEMSNGDFLVSGNTNSYSYDGNSGQYMDGWVIRMDSNGNEIWNKTYGIDDAASEIWEVQETSDGGIIMASHIGTNIGEYQLIKTNSEGDIEWSQNYDYGGGKLQSVKKRVNQR